MLETIIYQLLFLLKLKLYYHIYGHINITKNIKQVYSPFQIIMLGIMKNWNLKFTAIYTRSSKFSKRNTVDYTLNLNTLSLYFIFNIWRIWTKSFQKSMNTGTYRWDFTIFSLQCFPFSISLFLFLINHQKYLMKVFFIILVLQ